jgi:cell wall-associated NlpC family hydrolase
LKFIEKFLYVSVCIALAAVCFTGSATAQSRDRVVKPTSSQPTNLPPAPVKIEKTSSSHAVLTNDIVVVKPSEQLVKKTGSSKAVNAPSALAAGRTTYDRVTSVKLDQAIKERYGIPYHYGSTGPNSYDCSGFVWSAFQEAGINFTRSSAASLWHQSEPVDGDDRYKFGTLVFLNGLGHIGIVADENGFYHASSSKGITYSPFKGYWEKRIVGFRRLRPEGGTAVVQPPAQQR